MIKYWYDNIICPSICYASWLMLRRYILQQKCLNKWIGSTPPQEHDFTTVNPMFSMKPGAIPIPDNSLQLYHTSYSAWSAISATAGSLVSISNKHCRWKSHQKNCNVHIYFTRHYYRDDRALAALHIDRVGVRINPKDSVGGVIVCNSENMTTNVMCLRSIVTGDADKATTIGHPHLSLGTCRTTSCNVYSIKGKQVFSYSWRSTVSGKTYRNDTMKAKLDYFYMPTCQPFLNSRHFIYELSTKWWQPYF